MAVSADYVAYVIDQLAPFARVRSRRMFGGVGLYADDVFFGLIAEDTLYFKVDESNRTDYLSRGCAPFRPFADDPDTYSMSYFEAPADVLEDPDELKLWARKAAAAAVKAQAKRPKRKKTSAPENKRRRPTR
ncbi:MAG: TfoX/Sxy family protein [Steroidobacter sp.]